MGEVERRLEDLDVDTALRLLAEHRFGRLALNAPDGPLVVPVNYAFDQGAVVFRSDPGGKLGSAERHERASFQVDHVDLDHRVGWSVLVRGRLAEVVDPAALARVDALRIDAFAPGLGRAHVVRLHPAAITGRRITLPDDLPPGWFRTAIEGTTAFGSPPR